MLGKVLVFDGYNLWLYFDIREIKIVLKGSISKELEN